MSEARDLLLKSIEFVMIASVVEEKTNSTTRMARDLLPEIEEYLTKPEPKPVAWASENVIPLRGGKDNRPAILTPFKCEANTVALYAEPLERKPLSDEQILQIVEGGESLDEFTLLAFAREIEKAHGIAE